MSKDGGPAFPAPIQHDTWREDYPGMSLRDYFAAKAMHGLVVAGMGNIPTGNMGLLAPAAYELADAMLKAREQ